MWLKTLLLRINAEMGEGVRCYIATLLSHINNLFKYYKQNIVLTQPRLMKDRLIYMYLPATDRMRCLAIS